MASILNKVWSQADFWDKDENKRQRQQFAQQDQQQAQQPQPQSNGWGLGRVVRDVTHNPITDTVGGAAQHVAKPIFNLPQTVTNDVFRPTANLGSRAFDQVNVFDNNRTFKQRTPTSTNSVLNQATHNGAMNFAGDIAKPLFRTGQAVSQGIGNLEELAVGRRPMSTQQVFGDLNNWSGYTGTKRQITGDLINTAATAITPGVGRGIETAFKAVVPKAVPSLATKVVANAGAGAVGGAPFNIGSYVASEQPLTVHGLQQSALQGAQFGALLGAAAPLAGEVVPVAARGAVRAAQKAPDAAIAVRRVVDPINTQLADHITMLERSKQGKSLAAQKQIDRAIQATIEERARINQKGSVGGEGLRLPKPEDGNNRPSAAQGDTGAKLDRNQVVSSRPSVDPLAALKQEALKHKSADEFVNSTKPENIPVAKGYNESVAIHDTMLKRADAALREYRQIEQMARSPQGQALSEADKIALFNKYQGLVKERESLLHDATMMKHPETPIKTHIGEKGIEQQLTDLYNQAHAEAKSASSGRGTPALRIDQTKVPVQDDSQIPTRRTNQTPASQPLTLKSESATGKQPPHIKSQSQNKQTQTGELLPPTRGQKGMAPKTTPQEKSLPVSRPESSLSNRSYGIDNTTNVVKKRGLVKSVKASNEVSPEVSRKVNGKYNVRNTAKLAVEADTYANKNLKTAVTSVNDRLSVQKGKITDQDVADALAVAKRLDATKQFDASQQIYDKLAEHGTASGQTIQAFSLLKNRTPDGIKFQVIRGLKKAGVVLNDTEQSQLGKLIDGVRKTKPGTEQRDRALFNAMDFASRRLPTNRGDKLANFWRAGLLTAPKTTGGNILGNTSEALTRDLWANPVAAATDKFFSLFTGKRTKVLAGGRAAGAKQGLQRGADYLKTGYDTRNIGDKFDVHKRPNYNNKIVDNYVNGVYRWMGAQDQPFYYAAKSAAVHDLAKADAKNLGYKGKQMADYIENALHNNDWKPQTFKTAKDATEYARYSVFQNDTMLAHMASGVKNELGKKNARWLADFIMPFTQVPSSVAMRVIDRTPVGIAKEIVTQIKNKSFDQRAMSEAIGNGSFGIGVLGAGYALAKSGDITGAYPKDPKERKLWQSEGKQEYSVKIGGRWHSLNYMQPFGTILSIGKQVSDDIKDGKSPAEAWNSAGATAAQSVSSQSFLQGINGVVSAITDPQESAGQFTKSLATSTMPNFIRSLASATDSTQRDTKSFGNALKGTVPGLRETLPAKQDMFGQSMPSKDNPANMYANPFNPSKVRDQNDAVIKELRRLQDSKNGIVPTQFDKNAFKDEKLTDSQVRQLNSLVNGRVRDEWSKMTQDPRYKGLSDEDKATALKSAKDRIASALKRQFAADNNITSALSKPATAAQSQILGNSMPDFLTNAGGTTQDAYYKTPDAEYKSKLATYNTKIKDGSYTIAGKLKAQKELQRLDVGKVYPKDVRDLYSVSKSDLNTYLTTEEKGVDKAKIAKQLIAYDQALYNAGLETSLKYKNGIAPSKGGGSRSTTNKAALAKFKIDMAKQPLKIVGALPAPTKGLVPSFKTPALKTVYRKRTVNSRPKSSLTRVKR